MEIVVAILICVAVIAVVFTMHRRQRIKRQMRLACRHRRSSRGSGEANDAGEREARQYRRMIFFERVLLVAVTLVMIALLAWYLGRILLQ
jgi:uncharacterized ion transporter superfamily protein YfcC